MTTLTLTRAQLYDRAWAEPIHRLAPQLGLSDVGLAKLCRRLRIPVPGRGYWRRKETGHRVRQTPLPAAEGPQSPPIVFKCPEPRSPAAVSADVHPLIGFERQPENRVIVDDDIEANHQLIRETRHCWAAMRNNTAVAARHRRLDVQVSRESLPRALRILQALLVAFDRRGFEVRATFDATTTVRVLEQDVQFRLEEREKQVLHEPTKAEQEAAKRGLPVRKWDQAPTGRLALKTIRRWAVGRRVADSASQRLEERLNEFIELIVELALIQQAEQAEADREERERQEAERQRKADEARRREEEARINGFEHLVAAWERTETRRACLSRLREVSGSVEPDSEMGRWLHWAEGFVDRNDPMNRVQNRAALLTVYYAAGYGDERVLSAGFVDNEPTPAYGREPEPPGILVSDHLWLFEYGGKNVALELPEEALLPFECSEDGHWARRFRVPARVLNQYLKSGTVVDTP